MNHYYYMKRALQLAGKAVSYVSPNPAVGAVLVKDNKIIGEGYHRGPGTRHGEVDAMENSVESPKGAILYTTLEPCCSTYPGKRQPPCTDRIIAEGISRVVIAAKDHNPNVCGQGIEKLRKAGITVESGILEEQANRLNEIFNVNQLEGRPFVHMKIAQTLDGRIATGNGDSRWITDEEARSDVHGLRGLYDAILAGAGTVKKDNPLLTVRGNREKSMRRIVLSSHLSFSPDYRIFEDQEKNPTTIITSSSIKPEKLSPFRNRGIHVLQLKTNENGDINPSSILSELFKMGIRSLFIEGGAEIFTTFLKNKQFDKITVYTAPLILGQGLNSVGDLQTETMSDALQLKDVTIRIIGSQSIMTGYRC